MVEVPQIIIPRPGGATKPYQTPGERWQEVTQEMYGSAELPTTIHHEHDPEWNNRFWSIQSAHDQYELKKFGFWTIIGVLFLLSDLTWYVRIR